MFRLVMCLMFALLVSGCSGIRSQQVQRPAFAPRDQAVLPSDTPAVSYRDDAASRTENKTPRGSFISRLLGR